MAIAAGLVVIAAAVAAIVFLKKRGGGKKGEKKEEKTSPLGEERIYQGDGNSSGPVERELLERGRKTPSERRARQ